MSELDNKNCSVNLEPFFHAVSKFTYIMTSYCFVQVLVQGQVVTPDNVEEIISRLRAKLDTFESVVANSFKDYLDRHRSNFANVRSTFQDTLQLLPCCTRVKL